MFAFLTVWKHMLLQLNIASLVFLPTFSGESVTVSCSSLCKAWI